MRACAGGLSYLVVVFDLDGEDHDGDQADRLLDVEARPISVGVGKLPDAVRRAQLVVEVLVQQHKGGRW